MHTHKLRRIVARRFFQVARSAGAAPAQAVVEFAAPVRERGSSDFVCFYRISAVSCAGTRKAMGVDAVQALFLALSNAASVLYTCDEYKSGKLSFLQEKNLGLPAFSNTFAESIPDPKDSFTV